MIDWEFRDYIPSKPYRRVPDQDRPLPISMESPRFKAKPPPVPLVDLAEEVDDLPELEFNIDFKEAIDFTDEPPPPPPPPPANVRPPMPISKAKKLLNCKGTVAEILEHCYSELETTCSLRETITQSETVLQKLAIAEKPITAQQLIEMTGIDMKQLMPILRRLKLWEMVSMIANARKKRAALWQFLSWIGTYRKRKITDSEKK